MHESEDAGAQAIAVQADVSNSKDVQRLFDAAETAFGGVDVLVNNAAIRKLARFADIDDTTFDQTIAINLKGVSNGLREAARRLRTADASSTSRPASSACIGRPTAFMRQPMPPSKR